MNIEFSNCNIRGDAQVMNGTKVNSSDAGDIKFTNTEIMDNAKVLENLEIGSFFESLQSEILEMDQNSVEYPELRKFLGMERTNKKAILQKIGEHLFAFSEGVLSNIVSNMLMPK